MTVKKQSIDRVRLLKYLIEALDSARIGNIKDIDKISRVIQDLGLRKTTSIDWDHVLQEVTYIYEIPKKDKEYTKVVKLDKLALFFTIFSFLGLIVIGVATYLFKNIFLYNISIIITLISVNLIYIIRFYTSMKINKIYLSHIDDLEEHGIILKEAINTLLPRLRSELKKNNFSLDDFKLNLKLIDYKWILVKKKLSFIRSGYEVVFRK